MTELLGSRTQVGLENPDKVEQVEVVNARLTTGQYLFSLSIVESYWAERPTGKRERKDMAKIAKKAAKRTTKKTTAKRRASARRKPARKARAARKAPARRRAA
jgi:hypothetical protein